MREIKFRAWDYDDKSMKYFNGIFNKQPWTETSTFPQYESCPKMHKVDIMQYTGLKDMNGMEIYEGDILLWDNGYDHMQKKETVEFKNGEFVSKGKNGFDMREIKEKEDGGGGYYDFKVIGNIYENPELLNKDPS